MHSGNPVCRMTKISLNAPGSLVKAYGSNFIAYVEDLGYLRATGVPSVDAPYKSDKFRRSTAPLEWTLTTNIHNTFPRY